VVQNQKDWGQFEKNRADIASADVVGGRSGRYLDSKTESLTPSARSIVKPSFPLKVFMSVP